MSSNNFSTEMPTPDLNAAERAQGLPDLDKIRDGKVNALPPLWKRFVNPAVILTLLGIGAAAEYELLNIVHGIDNGLAEFFGKQELQISPDSFLNDPNVADIFEPLPPDTLEGPWHAIHPDSAPISQEFEDEIAVKGSVLDTTGKEPVGYLLRSDGHGGYTFKKIEFASVPYDAPIYGPDGWHPGPDSNITTPLPGAVPPPPVIPAKHIDLAKPDFDAKPVAPPVIETPKAGDTLPQDIVSQYELTDGDGITQGIMKLKAHWPAGVEMPQWLSDIKTPSDAAQWAEANHWYSPHDVKDSVIMYKGDTLSIDRQGNLTIQNAAGAIETQTDILGRAGPESLGTRGFSDSMPNPTAPVESSDDSVKPLLELSDDARNQLNTDATILANTYTLEYVVAENPYTVGTPEYAAWANIHQFLVDHVPVYGDSWKEDQITVRDYLNNIGLYDNK